MNGSGNPATILWSKNARPWNVVNGVIRPYYKVPKAMVRLRILNGSSRKALRFALSIDTTGTNYLPFYIVADDGGYAMHASDHYHVLTIGPGARTEIVVDLTQGSNGESYYLRNLASTLDNSFVGGHPGANSTNGGGPGDVTAGNVLIRLEIDSTIAGAVQTAPTFARNWSDLDLDTNGIDFRRTKYLVKVASGTGYVIADSFAQMPANPTHADTLAFLDQNTFKMNLLNDVICVPSKEEWTIENHSNVSHPFHIHKIFFRITQIDSMDWSNNTVKSHISVSARGLDAPKDDVLIHPGWRLKWIANFDDYGSTGTPPADSGMMYHCHILTHEDGMGGGMMHQFGIQKNTGNCTPSVGRPEVKAPIVAKIFPNPTDHELFLRAESTTPSTIRIFDYMGRLLRETSLNAFEGTVAIDVNGLPRGLLLVEWTSAKGKLTSKVLMR